MYPGADTVPVYSVTWSWRNVDLEDDRARQSVPDDERNNENAFGDSPRRPMIANHSRVSLARATHKPDPRKSDKSSPTLAPLLAVLCAHAFRPPRLAVELLRTIYTRRTLGARKSFAGSLRFRLSRPLVGPPALFVYASVIFPIVTPTFSTRARCTNVKRRPRLPSSRPFG